MRNILITGGLGFIGSHVSLALLKEGFDVIILDSSFEHVSTFKEKLKAILNLKSLDLNNRCSIHRGDIRNTELLRNIFISLN